MASVVLDIQKVPASKEIRGLLCHNLRQRDFDGEVVPYSPDNCDLDRSNLNRVLIGPTHLNGTEALANSLLPTKQPSGRKVRKDAVRYAMVDVGISAEWFGGRHGEWDARAVKDFAQAAVSWLTDSCPGQVVSAVLHLDETTPHVHALLIPLTPDGSLAYKRCFGDARSPEILREVRKSWYLAASALGSGHAELEPGKGGPGIRGIDNYKADQKARREADRQARLEEQAKLQEERAQLRLQQETFNRKKAAAEQRTVPAVSGPEPLRIDASVLKKEFQKHEKKVQQAKPKPPPKPPEFKPPEPLPPWWKFWEWGGWQQRMAVQWERAAAQWERTAKAWRVEVKRQQAALQAASDGLKASVRAVEGMEEKMKREAEAEISAVSAEEVWKLLGGASEGLKEAKPGAAVKPTPPVSRPKEAEADEDLGMGGCS